MRGYLSIEVTPETWTTNYRVVDYVSRLGAPLRTCKRYVVAAGAARLNEA